MTDRWRIQVRAVNGDGPRCRCEARSALHVIAGSVDVFLCAPCVLAFAAALADDMAGIIVAVADLSETRLEQLIEAAQLLEAQADYFLASGVQQ